MRQIALNNYFENFLEKEWIKEAKEELKAIKNRLNELEKKKVWLKKSMLKK